MLNFIPITCIEMFIDIESFTQLYHLL